MNNTLAIPQPHHYLAGSAKWILVGTALLCALLEMIDSTVVNVSLREMMGSLGATSLEIAWVVTAYSLGNVITVPLSAMLSSLWGRKIYFTASVLIFTFASLMCGFSGSLWVLVFWRFVQGLGGGALLSTAQSIIADAFPPEQITTATAIFGVGLLLGPAFGPVMGGYITDHWSWHWIFFINVPLGIIAGFLSWQYVPNLEGVSKPKSLDWWGIIFMVIGLCSLQYFLEEGPKKDWFDSGEMQFFAIVAIAGIIAFVWRELRITEPAVNIKLYKNINLAVAHLMNIVLGAMLIGVFFIFPLFTQVSLNWTATQQGAFLIPSALASAVFMIVANKLLKYMNYHFSAIIGIVLFSSFLILLSFSAPDSSEKNFFWPFMLSSAGRAFLMIPLMSMALWGLRGQELAQATGLSNIMRQLGSAIGIAIINIYINHENSFVRNNMISHINPYNTNATDRISALSQIFTSNGASTEDSNHAALKLIDSMLTKQQNIVTYDNAYFTVGSILLLCILLILMLRHKKDEPEKESTGITH